MTNILSLLDICKIEYFNLTQVANAKCKQSIKSGK